ncbi:MAG TPA: glycosyltransferase family 2 protein [Bryobacteraceae bacterium]|nr:glycosyltransferase family 2 protein [Bryobacteraceae bacterium]
MSGVSAVIPTWNRRELLMRVLADLARQTYPIVRVIVVDNGSTDDAVEVAVRAGAEVIALGKNLGFAAAVNQGIERARSDSDWIAILNNDVTLEPDWLKRLVTAAEASGAAFASGKLLDASARGRIDGTFDALCRGGCAWRCGHGRVDSEIWNRPRTIQMAPFTAAAFRSDLFDQVGLLDEQFESYLEDVDFGLRCALRGLTGLYVPDAVAYHAGSATLGEWHRDTVRRMARNQVLLVAKHYPPNWIKRYGWSVIVAQILWGFVALRHRTFLGYLAGKKEGVQRFRAARGKSCAEATASIDVSVILDQSEKEIHELQSLTGFDLFWRLYFALT